MTLLKRLQNLTGPDRETDALVEQTLPGVLSHPDKRMDPGYVISGAGHPRYGHAGQAYLAPRYTESMDAALSLIANGISWQVTTGSDGRFHAFVGKTFYQDGATPAIALTIAALLARGIK